MARCNILHSIPCDGSGWASRSAVEFRPHQASCLKINVQLAPLREPTSLLEHKEMHVPGCDDELVYPSADRVFKAFTWNDTIVSLGVTRLERGIEDLVMCLSLAFTYEVDRHWHCRVNDARVTCYSSPLLCVSRRR